MLEAYCGYSSQFTAIVDILATSTEFVSNFNCGLGQLFKHEGFSARSLKYLKYLLDKGADLFEPDQENDDVPYIFTAILEGQLGFNELMELKNSVKDWNVTDQWGRNILHYYLSQKYRRILDTKLIYDTLIEFGVDVNHKATTNDEIKVVSFKLTNSLPKCYGKTPMEMMKELSNTKIK